MTPDQDVKMELLKSYFRERNQGLLILAAELRARGSNVGDGFGAAVDRLYDEIENGIFRQ